AMRTGDVEAGRRRIGVHQRTCPIAETECRTRMGNIVWAARTDSRGAPARGRRSATRTAGTAQFADDAAERHIRAMAPPARGPGMADVSISRARTADRRALTR